MKKGKTWLGRKDFSVKLCYESDQKLVSPERRKYLTYFDFTSEPLNVKKQEVYSTNIK